MRQTNILAAGFWVVVITVVTLWVVSGMMTGDWSSRATHDERIELEHPNSEPFHR